MAEMPDTTVASDEELLRRSLRDPQGIEGRRAASALLARYQRQVYVWCLRYAQDHERALEMAQEVLTRAYVKLRSFEGRSRFGSWLFVVTRSHCLNEVARPRLLVEPEEDPDRFSSEDPDPERALLEKLDEESVLETIERHLDPVEQKALWLRSFERMPVEAITAVLGIRGPSGARGVLQRGRRKLRAALEAQKQAMLEG
jgi:RNA polymerase sigma-70 factor (ECF subfamily)